MSPFPEMTFFYPFRRPYLLVDYYFVAEYQLPIPPSFRSHSSTTTRTGHSNTTASQRPPI